MSEHKSIIIDLEESERTQLGELSNLETIEASGVLSVNNVSDKSRIWNARVHVGGCRDRTDIAEDVITAGEVDVGAKWKMDYKIKIDGPLLTFTETYDTCGTVSTESPHWAYVHGKDNPVKITLRVKNDSGGPIDAIIINKSMPPQLSDIKIESTKSGKATFDEGTRQLVWKDFMIYPNEDSVLVLTAIGRVDEVTIQNAGEITVTYRAEDQQRSVLYPDLTAQTDFLSGIERAETQPNQWEVTLECSNQSDLMVRIDNAVMYLIPEDSEEKRKMVDVTPHVELEPDQSWTTKFSVESKSPPNCIQEVIHTPMRIVTKRVYGTIRKTPQSVPVARISYTKSFDPPEVNSMDKTPVEVTIEVKNVGTARLNEVRIEDQLPDDIMPPKRENISIWVAGKEYKGPVDITIEPDNQEPTVPHRLTFVIKDLKDTVGELQPGETIKINYAIMAWRNRPEKQYPSPISCSANTFPAGLTADTASAPDGHKLGVIYRKRAISAKKSINKGTQTGEYVVILLVENKGEVTVENVKVVDWVPAAFKYERVEPVEESPTTTADKDGTLLTWVWARMNPGDKKQIHVTVSGTGEYERREPEVTSD